MNASTLGPCPRCGLTLPLRRASDGTVLCGSCYIVHLRHAARRPVAAPAPARRGRDRPPPSLRAAYARMQRIGRVLRGSRGDAPADEEGAGVQG